MTHTVKEPPFFGRTAEMAYLRERVARPGLTVLTGRPQIGKSRLLRELVARIRQEGRHLVGYVEANETESAILYAAADLYKHAIADARWRDELRIIWETRPPDLPMRVVRAVGESLAAATPVKDAFNKVFGTLATADEAFRTGGGRTVLKPITVDETRSLLELAGHVDKERSLLLVLDQWEDGIDPELEASLIRSYLRNAPEWPDDLHVILHIRHPADDTSHPRAVRAWTHVSEFGEQSAAVAVMELLPLDFEEDHSARDYLLRWLAGLFPFIKELPAGEILAMIAGNPAVLRRWLDGRPSNIEELRELASHAHQYHYPEIRNRLRELNERQADAGSLIGPFEVALRLALLSDLLIEQVWQVAKPVVLRGAGDSVLDVLLEDHNGLLIELADGTPTFGHPKRREAATTLVTTDGVFQPHARRELGALVVGLAEKIVSSDEEKSAVAGLTIAALHPRAAALDPGRLPLALICAAHSLLPPGDIRPCENVCTLEDVAGINEEMGAGAARLLAVGLVNTLIHAKEEGDLTTRDRLLDELRQLRTDYPDDPAVRDRLAKALFNTLYHAKEEGDLLRRDRLLDELRQLRTDYPDDPAVRDRLAKALFNTHNDSKEEDNLPGGDQLLDELRQLRTDYPDDPVVRERVARGLLNALNTSKDGGSLPRRDRLLDELRQLRIDYPDDPAVRNELAKGLFNTLNHAKEEGDLRRRGQLLDELRRLRADYPEDPTVRENLAKGFVNTVNHAREERDPPSRDRLLDELRQLRTDYPEDAPVRKQLAMGLFNTLVDVKEERDFPRRDQLLNELRQLRAAYPDDGWVLAALIMCLSVGVSENDDEKTVSSMKSELTSLVVIGRDLVERHPHSFLSQVLKDVT